MVAVVVAVEDGVVVPGLLHSGLFQGQSQTFERNTINIKNLMWYLLEFAFFGIKYLSDCVEEGSLFTVFEAVKARFEGRCAVTLAKVGVADACNSNPQFNKKRI